jgi:hypothetical protein
MNTIKKEINLLKKCNLYVKDLFSDQKPQEMLKLLLVAIKFGKKC